jgi:hypothetical protein
MPGDLALAHDRWGGLDEIQDIGLGREPWHLRWPFCHGRKA